MSFLVVTGFFQSIFWTATNAFTFADIEDKDAGQANVISQVGVQLSLAFGVALGGGALEAVAPAAMAASRLLLDFHFAFYVIAAVGAHLDRDVLRACPRMPAAHLTRPRRQAVEAAAE